MKRSNIWIVIPGLNEEKYIADVLKKVRNHLNNIIVVNDGSTDKTARIAKRYTDHVLTHSINLGKGAALNTGCQYAFKQLGAEAVIFLDSDDQHDPAEIDDFIAKLEEGASVVFGVRSFDEHMPLFRIILNRLASVTIYALFGSYIPDIPSGFKALSKKAYNKIQWEAPDYAVEIEIAAKVAKYNIQYEVVPIKTIYHDFDRGMTILDTIHMIARILSWRISL